MLSAQAGQSYRQLTQKHPGWLQVPGALVRPDCVHEIPEGAAVNFSDDDRSGDDVTLNGQIIAHYDPCPEAPIDTRHLVQEPTTGNGWVQASQWDVPLKSGDNIDWMQGYWIVPSIPKTNGALVYLFNGIEPTGGGVIMQPVLQHGSNGAFGGNYWVIASWLAKQTSSNSYYSKPLGVNPGDLLVGTTEQTGASGGKLYYLVDAYDSNTGANTRLSVWSTGHQWVWAYAGVLEAYYVTSCSEYPASGVTNFFAISVAHGYPNLDYFNPLGFYGAEYDYFGHGGPQCNFNVKVAGSSSTLYF